MGVGLGHEGQKEAEAVADGAVGGASGGLDSAEEGGVDGRSGGAGGALDQGRYGGIRRRGEVRIRAWVGFRRRRRPAGGERRTRQIGRAHV